MTILPLLGRHRADRKYEVVRSAWRQLGEGRRVYRIRALRSFGRVMEGEWGGWVASTRNLSPVGLCWVGEEACVCDAAYVYDDAQVLGRAIVSHWAQVGQAARVQGSAWIAGHGRVLGYADVGDEANVGEHAVVTGLARLRGDAQAVGRAFIGGRSRLDGRMLVDVPLGMALIDTGAEGA